MPILIFCKFSSLGKTFVSVDFVDITQSNKSSIFKIFKPSFTKNLITALITASSPQILFAKIFASKIAPFLSTLSDEKFGLVTPPIKTNCLISFFLRISKNLSIAP